VREAQWVNAVATAPVMSSSTMPLVPERDLRTLRSAQPSTNSIACRWQA
jgi:hypothetical protein